MKKNKKIKKTPLEAYQILVDTLKELKRSGIEVSVYRAKYGKNPRTTKDGIPNGKWFNALFKNLSPETFNVIKDVRRELSGIGIYFDRLIGGREVEWQIDWSFRYTEPKEKEEETTNA